VATLTVPQLIAASAESHATFLGEDFIGWRVAIIVGLVALIVWETVTALTRTVSLRLPFLILYTARLFMPKDEWKAHYKRWKAELWFDGPARNHGPDPRIRRSTPQPSSGSSPAAGAGAHCAPEA
jgi:hypothetical protein